MHIWLAQTTATTPDAHGFGFYAVELPRVAPFIGFVGLQHVRSDMPFAPGCVTVQTRFVSTWKKRRV